MYKITVGFCPGTETIVNVPEGSTVKDAISATGRSDVDLAKSTITLDGNSVSLDTEVTGGSLIMVAVKLKGA